MKTLILFATKSGASQECAELLATKIPNCTTQNLSQKTVDIDRFDRIILGSGVWIGKIYKPASRFIKKNKEALKSKQIAFYFCNSDIASVDKIITKNIPSELVQCAISIKSLGGKIPFSKPENNDWQNQDNINEFLNMLNR